MTWCTPVSRLITHRGRRSGGGLAGEDEEEEPEPLRPMLPGGTYFETSGPRMPDPKARSRPVRSVGSLADDNVPRRRAEPTNLEEQSGPLRGERGNGPRRWNHKESRNRQRPAFFETTPPAHVTGTTTRWCGKRAAE